MTGSTRKEHKGLSPSSFQLMQACGRKYYFLKVAKIPVDRDYDNDQTVFNIGKAFHRACEDSLHEPSKLSLEELSGICELHELDTQEYLPVVMAMLEQYEKVHLKSGLNVIACEFEIETDVFYGIADVILADKAGNWWIGDLKTAASFTPAQVAGLLSHAQLNLYAAHAPVIARAFNLSLDKFQGCRYRVTTKSKIKRKAMEDFKDYVYRLGQSIKSMDFVLPFERMNSRAIYLEHKKALATIKAQDAEAFKPNYGNCFSYYRPCEFWSQCNGGKCYSEVGEIEVISS